MSGYVSKRDKELNKKYPEFGFMVERMPGLWKIRMALWFGAWDWYILRKRR